MELNDITYKIRGAIFTVHKELGPGLLESVYEAALAYDSNEIGLKVKTQVGLPVEYKSILLELVIRMDILVINQIVIEIKSVDTLQDVHKKQLLTYLKLAGKRVGIIANFNTSVLVDKESLVRIKNA
mgnify:CR=1 FL=1